MSSCISGAAAQTQLPEFPTSPVSGVPDKRDTPALGQTLSREALRQSSHQAANEPEQTITTQQGNSNRLEHDHSVGLGIGL
jgi:hypothetical protein